VSKDWLDYVLDGEPTPITYRQLVIIESRIDRADISLSEKSEILNNLNNYTELEAEEIIKKILENEIKTDPKDQWKEMFKSGMFKDKPV
tara:strand:- start:80 stop:346 length:267 start_codon:yes stop_codon:yes gene_type:complete